MLKLSLSEKYDNPLIQSNWSDGLLPHFSGIVIGDGTMLEFEESVADNSEGMKYKISIRKLLTISEFQEQSDEFVEIELMATRLYIPDADCYALCGEGAMGNEGFVALVKGNSLVWSAFLTVSNPFYILRREGDLIVAKSTHEVEWRFPIYAPWDVAAG